MPPQISQSLQTGVRTAHRSRQIAARSHLLLWSHTAPTIQPRLLMSVARPEAPPPGAGSTSIPPPTGHITGLPESRYSPEFPTTSPLLLSALGQALVDVCPAVTRSSEDAGCQPRTPSNCSVHRTPCVAN